ERFWQTILTEQICDVILHPLRYRIPSLGSRPQLIDFGERLENETRMEVVHKVSNAGYGVVPGSIRTLRFQNEVQITLGDGPITVLIQVGRRTCQQERTVSTGINHATFAVNWRVGTAPGGLGNGMVFDIFGSVPRDASHCLSPSNICVKPVDLTKR